MSASLSPMRSPSRSIETLPPFRRSSECQSAIPATLSGAIPHWLRGEVVRTCPAVFESHGWRAHHWFDGLCLLYAFRIGGASVDFRSRLLDSATARDALVGKASHGSFGTPIVRSFFRRLLEPVPRISDNTNVNIVRMGEELVSMTEGDTQLVIDPETLAALRPVAYSGDALGGTIMTAHPHFDFERGKAVNVATGFGMGGTLSVYEHAPAARQRTVVASWQTKRVPYVHTFGLTPKHAILVAQPFDVTPAKMLWSNHGYIDHFDWRPEEGTRLVVLDRSGAPVREHLTDAFFFFHTVNAFERGDVTLLDLLAYPDADIMASLNTDRMVARLPDLRPSLLRVSLRPGIERATVEKLSDVGFEFPSINYKLFNGRAYRYAFGASDGYETGSTYASAIVKVDTQTGASVSFTDGKHLFGEPLFVSRPHGDGEDDGVLLSVGSAQDAETSVLAVIDAKSMTLIASAEVPSSIPLGFHGSFLRQGG